MNTATVSMAVTPTALSTFLSHYLHRKPLREQPTAHLSYDEGLHMIKSFLTFASQHTVEDLQAFTSQWVPHPRWVKVKEIDIPEAALLDSAKALQAQLGPEGIQQVGGSNWWQWRRPQTPLKAEWIEMRSDYNRRIETNDSGKRVMLYVHGGAYYFGSVDEHRYQMQRHARKLKARVFAPKYRLAPQFPFPCGLQDCLAAYLYLLSTSQKPNTIILAGDSAGGGMVLSMLVTLRDRGLPMPAGAVLISPWVDLTHSFPSVSSDCPLDYIPAHGFHHKPSPAWPPLNSDEHAILVEQVVKNAKSKHSKLMKPASVEMKNSPQELERLTEAMDIKDGPPVSSSEKPSYLSIRIDGNDVVLKDQMQMYTTNELLSHPLVSPIMQPTLGGLPPLLIMTGGGEILRDEQIYLAHKCAHPEQYPPGNLDAFAREQIARYEPTDVQLQIWDDLCHVAPTLSFTRPAKYMYRSIAQFGAWALAKAQQTKIEVLEDDQISVISSSPSDAEDAEAQAEETPANAEQLHVGKAGDALPPFKDHMIRQRVSRHGLIRPLEPASELAACNLDPAHIGKIKEGPVRKWLETRRAWDARYGNASAKVHKRRLKEMRAGYEGFDSETPPPSALAGRRKVANDLLPKKKRGKKGMGLALWSLWGSKHDEMEMARKEEKRPDTAPAAATPAVVDPDTPIASLMAKREGRVPTGSGSGSSPFPHPLASNPLAPTALEPPLTGATGKRPIVGGIAVPFSLDKDAETASMITLESGKDPSTRGASPTELELGLELELDRAGSEDDDWGF